MSLNDESEEVIALAAAVATAQLELVQIRQVRLALTNKCRSGTDIIHRNGFRKGANEQVLQDLRIERYERRAMSRRKKALARLEAALIQSGQP